MTQLPTVLIIACGAVARELAELKRRCGWDRMRIRCLPAELHNTPDRIPGAVAAMIDEHGQAFDTVFVAYADCGTGGSLDRVLEERGVRRLPGAHCYEFLAGSQRFRGLAEEEPGTFYLTDFLARHFDRLVRQGLGLDRHPELRGTYFGHYRRLALLSQQPDPDLTRLARRHAKFLGLAFTERQTGLGPLRQALGEGLRACRS